MPPAALSMLRSLPAFRSIALCIGALLLAGSACAAQADIASLIDAAGRQRMLTQRIVKAYCQVGLQVTPEVSRAQLTGAVKRFDQQLARLMADAPNADARGAAGQVAQQWRGMRQVAVGPVNRDAARRLAARGEAVLQASQVLVAMLENAAGTAQARLINLAGRQRMLSQRLAKLYMLRAYGVDTASIRDDLDSASREFETALASLRAAPENTSAIAVELEAVALQWEWFHSAIALQGAESYALVVADASESILNSMELITAKYAALARR